MPADDFGSGNGENAGSGPPSDERLERMLDSLLGPDMPDAPDVDPAHSSPFADPLPPDGNGQPDQRKVELDIDDAPFLREKEERELSLPRMAEPALPEAATQEKEGEDEEGRGLPGFLRRLSGHSKRLALAGGAVCLILLAPLVFLLVRGGEPAGQPAEAVQAQKAEPSLPAAPTPPLQSARYVVQGSPYLVPLRGSEGEIRFLRLSYTLATGNTRLFAELRQKNIPIRDAVYQYLSKKHLPVSGGEEQMKLLRSDLIHVINQQISADKLDELNFEEYLVTGK